MNKNHPAKTIGEKSYEILGAYSFSSGDIIYKVIFQNSAPLPPGDAKTVFLLFPHFLSFLNEKNTNSNDSCFKIFKI